MLLVLALAAAAGWGLLAWNQAAPQPAGARSGGPVAVGVEIPARLRVVGFNIHSAEGDDGRSDLARVASELAGADIAVLNEVRYSAGQGEALAGELGLELIDASTERRWGRSDFGNAIAVRVPVGHWAVLPLPRSFGRGWRNVTLAQVPLEDGRTLLLLGTHLDRGEDRLRQLDAVLALFESLEPPVLLVGDLNTTAADRRLAQTLAREDVDDVLARLAGTDGNHIDWLLFRSGAGVTAVAAGMRDTPASDHPVVWVELLTGLEDASE